MQKCLSRRSIFNSPLDPRQWLILFWYFGISNLPMAMPQCLSTALSVGLEMSWQHVWVWDRFASQFSTSRNSAQSPTYLTFNCSTIACTYHGYSCTFSIMFSLNKTRQHAIRSLSIQCKDDATICTVSFDSVLKIWMRVHHSTSSKSYLDILLKLYLYRPYTISPPCLGVHLQKMFPPALLN